VSSSSSEHTIFEEEEAVLRDAELILSSRLSGDELWTTRYEKLYRDYKKLLRHTRQLVKMGDAMQSELAKARDAAELEAKSDFLTRLWNRSAIMKVLHEETARSSREKRPLSIMIADVDFFKKINDNYGHLTGDAVLREIAARLKSSVRSYDQVGRFGGEEFIIVVPGCGKEDAFESADRIRTSIADNPIHTSEGVLNVTMSLGVATVDSCTTADVDSLIRKADEALYRAKRQGRNRVAT